jgi:hypothetical protein
VNRRLRAEYILPIRWADDERLGELTRYLRRLSGWIDVTVVDGSPQALFAAHGEAWLGLLRHVRAESTAPAAAGRSATAGTPATPAMVANGKAVGVMTGLRVARHNRVVIADDDVRYDFAALVRAVGLLGSFDVVRPQNRFTELPWHARWDTARSLINRAVASDYPGTLAVRRDVVLGVGGYRTDVLFENLELIRTVRAVGGTELRADDLFVDRLPPSARHFAGQRVRQAYDDFAQPARLAVELGLLPLLVWAAARPRRLLVVAGSAVVLAETGRRRGGGRGMFPPTSALWAPLWVLERAVCVWLALGSRLRGGVRYGGSRLRVAATPERELRTRFLATGRRSPDSVRSAREGAAD